MTAPSTADSGMLAVVSAVVSVVSLVVSGVAAYYAHSAKREADLNMLNTLQSDYEAIRARMDMRYRLEAWRPNRARPREWAPLEAYWFFCLREWLLTKGNPNQRFASLWDDHIGAAVKAGVRHAPLRFVLAAMRTDGTLDEGYTNGFMAELFRLHGSDFVSEFSEELRALNAPNSATGHEQP